MFGFRKNSLRLTRENQRSRIWRPKEERSRWQKGERKFGDSNSGLFDVSQYELLEFERYSTIILLAASLSKSA